MIKQVWNVERAASPQRFDGELRWGKERPARASERAHGDNDVGPGTRGDCTVKRETFCLRAEEGRRKGGRGGEVISPGEHIHFTVFSSALPQDITSLSLPAIIPPFTIIYVAKSLHSHTYLSRLSTRTAKRELRASHDNLWRKSVVF